MSNKNMYLIDGGQKQSEIHARNILKAFSNSQEMLKSEGQLEFEERVQKGEVEVVTFDEIKESHGNRFFLEKDIAALDSEIQKAIEKGETDFLEEDEFDALEKAIEERDQLVLKAVPTDKQGSAYLPVFVQESGE